MSTQHGNKPRALHACRPRPPITPGHSDMRPRASCTQQAHAPRPPPHMHRARCLHNSTPVVRIQYSCGASAEGLSGARMVRHADCSSPVSGNDEPERRDPGLRAHIVAINSPWSNGRWTVIPRSWCWTYLLKPTWRGAREATRKPKRRAQKIRHLL